MKTTVDLPDDLLIAAKKKAAELRRPLRELIEQGLRKQLSAEGEHQKIKRKTIRWRTVKGGLPPALDISDRTSMHDWLRKQKKT